MEIWTTIENIVKGYVPEWAELVLPALLIPAAIILALVGKRRLYPWIAAAVGILGFALVCARGVLTHAFLYLGLYALVAGVFALLLLIPKIEAGKGGKGDDRMYEKFHVALRENLFSDPASAKPAKVCCFEEGDTASAEESGLRLEHVREMLKRLRALPKLSPTDRLEADALSRTLDSLSDKKLTVEELGTLNDCLSTVLKLTAKYQL